MSRALLPALLAAAVAASACDPCAGTPSCNVTPELSYGGQFIEHRTGRAVGGVQVAFVRESGATLAADSVAATSDARGFFELRALAYDDGEARGRLVVTPPAPWKPYSVGGVGIRTSRQRGEGAYAGRLVVDPYIYAQFEARDRQNFAIAPGTAVTLIWTSGVRYTPDSVTIRTSWDGRAFVDLPADGAGTSRFIAVTAAPGYPRAYRIPRTLEAQYLDHPAYDVTLLLLGPSIQYVGEVLRRGTRENLPGVRVEFRRTGGILVSPAVMTPAINDVGLFAVNPEPLQDGVLIGDLTITPPAPMPVEVVRGLRLQSQDGDSTMLLGRFGYGSMLHLRAALHRRADGTPVPAGTIGVVQRTGGVPLHGVGASDDGSREVDGTGTLHWIAATQDSGDVAIAITMKLAPFADETIGNIHVRALYDTVSTARGPFAVGPWYPQYGEVRDSATNAPVANASVTFKRASGSALPADSLVTRTGADGRFRFTDVPTATGAVLGTLTMRFGGTYRDTVIAGAQLGATQDDTLRLLKVYRFPKVTP